MALEPFKLRTTNQVLYETIAKSDRKDIAERGELLLFAANVSGGVRRMISLNDLLGPPVHSEVYLYRHVLLFVSSHSTTDDLSSKPRLSRIRVSRIREATSTNWRRNLQKSINMFDVLDVQNKGVYKDPALKNAVEFHRAQLCSPFTLLPYRRRWNFCAVATRWCQPNKRGAELRFTGCGNKRSMGCFPPRKNGPGASEICLLKF